MVFEEKDTLKSEERNGKVQNREVDVRDDKTWQKGGK